MMKNKTKKDQNDQNLIQKRSLNGNIWIFNFKGIAYNFSILKILKFLWIFLNF